MKRAKSGREATARGRRGFVLIIVMVIVVMVSFAGFAFVNTMSDEYRAVHTAGDLLAAEQVLASAELFVLRSLERPPSAETIDHSARVSTSGSTGAVAGAAGLDPLVFQEQRLLPDEFEDASEDDPLAWRFSVVCAGRSAGTDRGAAEEMAGSSGLRFGLENESARLHLATLMELDAVHPERSRAVLMTFPGMTEATADALLDWLDADEDPRELGAEAEDYQDRPGGFQPRNGLPETLEELLLVREVTRAALFGPDEDRNFVIEPHEQQRFDLHREAAASESDPDLGRLGWVDLLTMHSAERNVDSSGRPRIDLNQASDEELSERLSADLTTEAVDFILQYRRLGPVARGGSGRSSPQSGGARGTRYRLSSVADLIDTRVSVTEGSSTRMVESPFRASAPQLLAELLDRTTTDARAVIPARININLAPRPVLLAVPGLTAEMIEQIVVRRAALDPQQLRTPAWLLTEQILTTGQFREVLPHITTGGDVFRTQLVAWRPAGGPFLRVEVVVDGTSRPARRVMWNDLSAWGAAMAPSRLSGRNVADDSQFGGFSGGGSIP